MISLAVNRVDLLDYRAGLLDHQCDLSGIRVEQISYSDNSFRFQDEYSRYRPNLLDYQS